MEPEGEVLEPERWFALEVKFQHERTVAKLLDAKGYRTFAPSYTPDDSSRGKQQGPERPLFPGYVFSRFDPKVRLPVLTTPGVHRVVGYGKVPTPIDSGEIDAIIEVVKSRCRAEPYGFLEAGTRVRVIRGPLAGIEGFLLQTRSSCRVVLSVSLIERSIRVELERDVLRPIYTEEVMPIARPKPPCALQTACLSQIPDIG